MQPLEFIHFYYDEEADCDYTDFRIIRLTSVIRLLVHSLCGGSVPPFLNSKDVELHKQILLCELKLQRLLHLTNMAKNIIL